MKRTNFLLYSIVLTIVLFAIFLCVLLLFSDPVERQGNVAIANVQHEIQIAGGDPGEYNWTAHPHAGGFLVVMNNNVVWLVVKDAVVAIGPKAHSFTPQLKQKELRLPRLKGSD